MRQALVPVPQYTAEGNIVASSGPQRYMKPSTSQCTALLKYTNVALEGKLLVHSCVPVQNNPVTRDICIGGPDLGLVFKHFADVNILFMHCCIHRLSRISPGTSWFDPSALALAPFNILVLQLLCEIKMEFFSAPLAAMLPNSPALYPNPSTSNTNC
jgi:hypothetical protein